MTRLLTYLLHLLRSWLLIIPVISVSAQQYYIEKFSVDEGISQSEITSIAEDKHGFLWMGTRGGGVCRFDGTNFTVYDERNGLGGDIVEALRIAADGKIYIGSSWGGFTVYNGIYFKKITPGAQVRNSRILDFAFGSNGEVYFCNGAQVMKYTSGKCEVIYDMGEKTQSLLKGLYTHEDGTLYFIFKNGFGRIVDGKVTMHNFSGNTSVTCISKGFKNTILLGTDGEGLFAFAHSRTGNLVPSPLHYLPQNTHVISIFSGKADDRWINCAEKGLCRLSATGKIKSWLNESNGMDANVNTGYTDKSGTLWLATSGAGLLKIRPPRFMNYAQSKGPSDPYIMAICKDSSDILWLGSSKNGLISFNQQTGESNRFNISNGLPSNEIRGICLNADGSKWLATANGLCLFQDGHIIRSYSKSNNNAPANAFRSVLRMKDGSLVAGTLEGGLFFIRPDGSTETMNTENSKVPSNNVHSLLEDSHGNLWMGTSNGIARMRDGYITLLGAKDGLCNSYVGCISEDKTGNVWFSTDRCVGKFDGSQIKSYDRTDGLGSNTCYFVKCDDLGNVWVGTNAGLDRLKLSSYGRPEKIIHYGKNDGFIGTECNTRSVFEDENGIMYFGTIKGVIRYQPAYDVIPEESISPLICGISLLSGKELHKSSIEEYIPFTTLPRNLELAPGNNDIIFEFASPFKNEPWNISFSYKMKGLNDDWSPPQKTRTASFINLPPGRYAFMVRTLNQYKEQVGKTASYAFTIDTPFWRTPAFFIINLVLLIAIVVYFNIRRTHKQELEKVILEKKVQQRTIELVSQKEERELLLKEIHHRVKNNLQVINSLINLQSASVTDPVAIKVFEECKHRIKSMALIHEKFYQSQDFSRIRLKEYIEGLAREIMSGHSLHQDVKLDVDVDEARFGIDTIIPLGLLLNEILTNSFKYAFTGMKSGEIKITLRNTGPKKYEMYISDNGSGFDHSTFGAQNASLGFELIRILSEQMNGEIELLPGKGTIYKVMFTDLEQNRMPKTQI